MKLNKSIVVVSGLALLLGAGCFGTPAQKPVVNPQAKPTAESPKGPPVGPPASDSATKESGTSTNKDGIKNDGPKVIQADPNDATFFPPKKENSGPPVK